MIKPGRSFSSSAYKHGFNTNESDAEVTGSFGNTYTAEYWMYDSRLGRRWERDPIEFACLSPYSVFFNNPIFYNDPDGDSPNPAGTKNILGKLVEFFKHPFNKKDRAIYANLHSQMHINFKWNGFANLFRDINIGPPAGRYVNQNWSSILSNSINQNTLNHEITVNIRNSMIAGGDSRVKMTGLEITGTATEGTYFYTTGGNTSVNQRNLFASNGIQNLTSPSAIKAISTITSSGGPVITSSLPTNYFEARMGILPGTNLIPNYYLLSNALDRMRGGNGFTHQFIATNLLVFWGSNGFNRRPPNAGTIHYLKFHMASLNSNATVNFNYRYRYKQWNAWLNKPIHVKIWHWFMYGSSFDYK